MNIARRVSSDTMTVLLGLVMLREAIEEAESFLAGDLPFEELVSWSFEHVAPFAQAGEQGALLIANKVIVGHTLLSEGIVSMDQFRTELLDAIAAASDVAA